MLEVVYLVQVQDSRFNWLLELHGLAYNTLSQSAKSQRWTTCVPYSSSGTLKDMLKINPWDKTWVDLLWLIYIVWMGKTKARTLWTYRQKLISWLIWNKKVHKIWHKELSRQGKWLGPRVQTWNISPMNFHHKAASTVMLLEWLGQLTLTSLCPMVCQCEHMVSWN